MTVLVPEAARAIASAYVQVRDPVEFEGLRYRAQRGGGLESTVGPVPVVVSLVGTQGTAQVGFVPDFSTTAFMRGDVDSGQDGGDAGVGEHLNDERGVLRVTVANEELHPLVAKLARM